jgi:hypothetical protein
LRQTPQYIWHPAAAPNLTHTLTLTDPSLLSLFPVSLTISSISWVEKVFRMLPRTIWIFARYNPRLSTAISRLTLVAIGLLFDLHINTSSVHAAMSQWAADDKRLLHVQETAGLSATSTQDAHASKWHIIVLWLSYITMSLAYATCHFEVASPWLDNIVRILPVSLLRSGLKFLARR